MLLLPNLVFSDRDIALCALNLRPQLIGFRHFQENAKENSTYRERRQREKVV